MEAHRPSTPTRRYQPPEHLIVAFVEADPAGPCRGDRSVGRGWRGRYASIVEDCCTDIVAGHRGDLLAQRLILRRACVQLERRRVAN